VQELVDIPPVCQESRVQLHAKLLTTVNIFFIWIEGMARKTHPDKHIESAVRHAEANGWIYKPAGGSAHCWGRLMCPDGTREGCRLSVWSTPASPEDHAKDIMRKVDRCPH
jgi:hypothetical protein